MTALVFGAVLFSAFFQAGWNFLTKKSKANKIALLAVGWFIFGVASLPFALWQADLSAIPERGWWMMLWSGLIHAAYLCLLGWAYSLGEISTVFPIARGVGIVFTTLLSLLLGLHALSAFGTLGITFVVCGALLIGVREVRHHPRRHAFFVAIGVAAVVGLYSVVDSIGARNAPLLLYLTSMDLLAPLIASPFLFWKMRTAMGDIVRFHKMDAFGVSVAGMIAYWIVLWAYQSTPTAYVATVREVSIVIATGLGAVFLKERITLTKGFAIALIVAGVGLIKLA